MPTTTLAATDSAAHEVALAAATVQTFVITPTGVLKGYTPRVRLFNLGTSIIYIRGGTAVAVQDVNAVALPPGSVTDFTPSTGTFSLISATATSVTVERQPDTDVMRIAGAGGGSGGGSSTPQLAAGDNTVGRVKITDGTNVAAIKAASTPAAATDPALVVTQSPNSPAMLVRSTSAAPIYERGSYVATSDDIAAAVNAVATTLAATDAVDLQSISVAVTVLTTYTGTVVFEVSNDGTNWVTKTLIDNSSGSAIVNRPFSAVAAGYTALASGDIGARYFRVRQTAYTSGQVRVVADLSALSTATIPQQAVALLAGNAVVGKVQLTDTLGNVADVAAAGIAAAAAKQALIVGLSPNSPLPAGGNTLGFVILGAGSNSVGGVSAVAAAESVGNLAALNAVAGGVGDLAGMGQVQVQVAGTFVATLAFQVSNDGTNWSTKSLVNSDLNSRTGSPTGPGLWFGHIGARYFRVLANAYTSGTAVVTIRYNAAAGEMPITTVAATLRATASADALAVGSVDEVALGAFNGTNVDRMRTAAGQGSVGNGSVAFSVATGVVPASSIAAASAPVSGTAFDNASARSGHTVQVDVATTAVGTAGTHSVVLEGSLDGTYFTTLATVTPASTSLTATDPSNHANASVGGFPYRYVRARWASIPTGWTGTLTARVASA